MGESWKWALIAAAGLVMLGMLLRGLMRLRGEGRLPDGGLSRIDAPPRGLSKIERIKRYREQHGVGLKEAKDAIEAELAGAPLPAPAPRASAATADIEALVDRGQLIEAIKLYRERHGVGLKEAKDAIDALRAQRTR